MRRAGKGRVDVAIGAGKFGDQIMRRIAVDGRRIGGERRAAVGGRFQNLEFDLDETCRVLGHIGIGGDDHGDRFADIDGLIGSEDVTVALLFVGLVRQRDDETVGRGNSANIVAGEHGDDARQRQSGALVDRHDLGMRMRTAHESGVQHAGQPDVADKARFAAQQVPVFNPGGRLSEGSGHAALRWNAGVVMIT